MKAFLQSAAHVTPSARQMAWFDTEFYALSLIHISEPTRH